MHLSLPAGTHCPTPFPAASQLPLLLTARWLATLTARSERSVWRDHVAGLLPRPVRLGRAVRWRRDEILAWIEAGCPDRQAWDARDR
jgi:predicted DNA-binding transcriptional regulator AlpA